MVNRRSIAVGPAVTVLVAMLGLDLYGIGGALVGFAYSVFVVAVVDELAPTDEHAVDLRSITG
jgi:predicted PurR-regulated permease PerM